MKNLLLAGGLLVLFIAGYNLFKYVAEYSRLTEYGKGYVWGNILLAVFGLLLLWMSRKRPGR